MDFCKILPKTSRIAGDKVSPLIIYQILEFANRF